MEYIKLIIICVTLYGCSSSIKTKNSDPYITEKNVDTKYPLKGMNGEVLFFCDGDTLAIDYSDKDPEYEKIVDCLFTSMFNGEQVAIDQLKGYYFYIRETKKSLITPFPTGRYYRNSDLKFRGQEMFLILLEERKYLQFNENNTVVADYATIHLAEMIKTIDGKDAIDYLSELPFNPYDSEMDYILYETAYVYDGISKAWDKGLIKLKAFGEE